MPNDNCVFNRAVSINLMYIDGRSILHCIEKDTNFNASSYLVNETTWHTWDTFTEIWVNTYIGFSNIMDPNLSPRN